MITVSTKWLSGLTAAVLVLAGCRGQVSEEPPIHLNPNMDQQAKYKAYGANPFFSDMRNMRTPPEGTVAQEGYYPAEETGFHTGVENGDTLSRNPMELTMELMERGRERYTIFCAVCHSDAGRGDGVVIKRGYVPAPSFHEDRIRALRDGALFNVITHGIRNMPAYGDQIPAADRWAIVAYVRALQRSQNASLEDVPQDKRAGLK